MRPITLNATSPFETPVDRNTGSRLWKSFLENGSMHSARASLVPYIMRRCEREEVNYVLTAMPGKGYHIRRLPAGEGGT